MKLKRILLVPIMCLLPACQQGGNSNDHHQSYEPEKITYYAFFMNNYPRVFLDSPNGFEERVDNSSGNFSFLINSLNSNLSVDNSRF